MVIGVVGVKATLQILRCRQVIILEGRNEMKKSRCEVRQGRGFDETGAQGQTIYNLLAQIIALRFFHEFGKK